MGGGTKLTDTEWMGYYFSPYNGVYQQFVLCVRGYSKIEIKTITGTSYQIIQIYTANDLSNVSKSSSEILLGSAQSTTGTTIDITGNDYIWFYCPDTTSGSNKEGFYRLLV